MRKQHYVNIEMKPTVMKAEERQDPIISACLVPLVAAMMAIVLLNRVMLNRIKYGD